MALFSSSIEYSCCLWCQLCCLIKYYVIRWHIHSITYIYRYRKHTLNPCSFTASITLYNHPDPLSLLRLANIIKKEYIKRCTQWHHNSWNIIVITAMLADLLLTIIAIKFFFPWQSLWWKWVSVLLLSLYLSISLFLSLL